MKWTRKYGPLAAGCLSLLIVSLVLYFLLDTVFNGVFVDWVESTFMLTWEEYVPSAGTYGIVQHINWHWVKPFLLGILVVNGLLWAGAVFVTRQLARRKKGEKRERQNAEHGHRKDGARGGSAKERKASGAKQLQNENLRPHGFEKPSCLEERNEKRFLFVPQGEKASAAKSRAQNKEKDGKSQ